MDMNKLLKLKEELIDTKLKRIEAVKIGQHYPELALDEIRKLDNKEKCIEWSIVNEVLGLNQEERKDALGNNAKGVCKICNLINNCPAEIGDFSMVNGEVAGCTKHSAIKREN